MDLEEILKAENSSGLVGGLEYMRSKPAVVVPYFILLILAHLMGTFGNCLIISCVVLNKGLRTVGNMFICNLALADLCVSSFVDIFNIISVVEGEIWFIQRPGLCDVVGIVCLTACLCSLYSIGAVGLNRYIHICHNNLYQRLFTPKKTTGICVILWIISFLVELPNIAGWGRHVYDKKTLTCLWDRTYKYSYTLFFAILGIIIPIVVISICYIKIFLHVIRSKRRVQAVEEQGKPSKRGTNDKSNSMKLARTLFIIFIVFVSCWAPYAIIILADFGDQYRQEIHMFAILIAHVNSSCNFFLYGVTNKQFREGYFRILGFYKCCPQLKPAHSTNNTVVTKEPATN